MARGKHSTALFEVISAGKRPAGRLRTPAPRPSAASLLRTPKWWFKNRSAPAAGAAAPAAEASDAPASSDGPGASAPANSNDPTANVTAASLSGRRAPAPPAEAAIDGPFLDPVAPEPRAPAPSPDAALPRDFSDPEPVLLEQSAEPPAAPAATALATRAPTVPRRVRPARGATIGAAQAAGALPRTGVRFGVDRDRQEITLRMRYTAALVGGFVVMVVVALAYVVGRHAGEAPPPHVSALTGSEPQAPSARDIRRGPVQPGALDPARGNARQASARLIGSGDPGARAGSAPAGDESGVYADAPINPDGTARRDVNRNYVIVQSYPLDMRDTAVKACNFLTQNRIPCTIEPRSNWLRVVGTRGFQRRFLDSTEYQEYRARIISLGEKFAGKSNFKQFEPAPYKWDGR